VFLFTITKIDNENSTDRIFPFLSYFIEIIDNLPKNRFLFIWAWLLLYFASHCSESIIHYNRKEFRMKHSMLKTALFLLTGFFLVIPAANATLIDFNGGTAGPLGPQSPMIEDGYIITQGGGDPSSLVDLGGGNLALSEINNYDWYGSGIWITHALEGHFTLDSFWADDLYDSNATEYGIWVNGYLDGAQVASKLVNPVYGTPTTYVLGEFTGVEIDALNIGGHEYGVTDDIVIDNINLSYIPGTAIPEPATMLLLGFGLVGLAGARRKIRT